MSSTSKFLRYRGVCPVCHRGFDTREGIVGAAGVQVCPDCWNHQGEIGEMIDAMPEEDQIYYAFQALRTIMGL